VSRPPSVLTVMGTRPEVIKLTPVVAALSDAGWARSMLVVTGQHRELADAMLETFGLQPDIDLGLMRRNQEPARLLARMLGRLVPLLRRHRPDLVIAQGDTTTVLASSLAAFHAGIPFGHVEAGLRSHDLSRPFPEEMNRTLASRLASLHFAPTSEAVSNLLREGVDPATVHLTGNPVVDMVRSVLTKAPGAPPPAVPGLDEDLLALAASGRRPLLLATLHRRENLEAGMEGVCAALASLARQVPGALVVWPVHPNPAVRKAASILADVPGVHLLAPLPYPVFLRLLCCARLVLTDSGGVQEEAVVLRRPLVVLRQVTERPEAVSSGLATVAGIEEARVVRAALDRLAMPDAGIQLVGPTPFGDGLAGRRIADIVRTWWNQEHRRSP